MESDGPSLRAFSSQGLALQYVDWGNEYAPLLVLVHGSRDHARSWDWTARALRKHWHVIAPDLRGHGDSAWSTDGAYLTPYYLLDFVALMETFGGQKAALVAHSFGAGIASRYAALYPEGVSKLVVVDGFGPTPQNYSEWQSAGPVPRTREWVNQRRDLQKSTRRYATLDAAVARMATGNPRLTAEQAHHLTSHGVRHDAAGFAWKFDPRVSFFTPEDFCVQLAAFWRDIDAPTLLCYGAESWSTNPRADGRAAFLRDCRVVAIEQAGHWPHHDQFRAFVELLIDFLG